MKIGVLGGTFDPVHLGHIAMADEARGSLGLDQVILVPAGRPVFKARRKLAPALDRLEMLRLAVGGSPGLKVSAMEIERPGPSYTVDTLAALKKEFGSGAELYFILGWDSLAQVPGWREPRRILDMCFLVAVPRPGFPRPGVASLEKALPGIGEKLVFLDRPVMDISATAIRRLAASGGSLDGLVPAPVAVYIKEHRLYTK